MAAATMIDSVVFGGLLSHRAIKALFEVAVPFLAERAVLALAGPEGEIKRIGGDEIEFAAVRQAPVPLGGAIVTPAGNLAAKYVIHAVSLDRERRTSGPVIEAAVRSAMARAREIGATSMAFPALGTGVGGFPLEEAARITVDTVRDELAVSPLIAHVVFALRGSAAYKAFGAALHPAHEPIGGGPA